MITVSLGGKEIVVRPKRLLDYVEKLDFIKSRRQQPYDLLRDFPQEKGQKGADATRMLIEIAMQTVYTRSSSVSIEEEICFDGSFEGFYYNAWRCTRSHSDKDTIKGIDWFEKVYAQATDDERIRFRMALEATDESKLEKNSDGPNGEVSRPGDQASQP